MNRKLIRPTLAEIREKAERDSRRGSSDQNRKRVPPEQTHAESFYYKKQMDNKTKMVLVLQDGEELRGTIEWYDRNCIKLHRAVGPNLLVLKHNVKYIFKDGEGEDNDNDSDDGDGDGVDTVDSNEENQDDSDD
jgi:sRNA-binding regulator protein Hfq